MPLFIYTFLKRWLTTLASRRILYVYRRTDMVPSATNTKKTGHGTGTFLTELAMVLGSGLPTDQSQLKEHSNGCYKNLGRCRPRNLHAL